MSINDICPEEPVTAGSTTPLAVSRTEVGASPIFTHVWSDRDELNTALRRAVLRHMATSPGLKKSQCGGWQSERSLQLWKDPGIDALLERMHTMLRSVVRQTVRTADDPGSDLLEGWDIEAWANVNQRGDTVSAHVHSGGTNMWAAIYYVDCGHSPDALDSGFTRFMDTSGTPRPILTGTPASRDHRRKPGSSCAEPEPGSQDDLQVEPIPGKMVVFPATLPHYVTPYLGTDKRITIAFNLRHTRFVVADFENRDSRRRTLWRNFRGVMLIMFAVKRLARSALATVVPVERWPARLRRTLLGGTD